MFPRRADPPVRAAAVPWRRRRSCSPGLGYQVHSRKTRGLAQGSAQPCLGHPRLGWAGLEGPRHHQHSPRCPGVASGQVTVGPVGTGGVFPLHRAVQLCQPCPKSPLPSAGFVWVSHGFPPRYMHVAGWDKANGDDPQAGRRPLAAPGAAPHMLLEQVPDSRHP